MLLVAVLLSACAPSTPTPTATPPPTEPPRPTPVPVIPNPQFGICWSADFRIHSTPPTHEAARVGATWDRWTFEWPRIEFTSTQELFFVNENYPDPSESWNYDKAVREDSAAGLRILGVLNGIPEKKYFVPLAEGRGTIQGLDEPPFVNGDPNPHNPWAYFVYHTTSRYADLVDAWEIGNEADDLYHRNFPLTPEEYIKALRVACQVIAQTDPGAPILLGSPQHTEAWETLAKGGDTWYGKILELLKIDDNADVKDCITAAGLHVFGAPTQTYTLTAALSGRLGKEVWLTETGKQHPEGAIPGDPATDADTNCPKDPNTGQNAFPCGTTAQQATYIIRNFAFALQGFGKDGVLFHHRLVDGTGMDGPWGLIQRDNRTRWPSYWAALLATQKLNGATFYTQTYYPGGDVTQLVFQSQNRFTHVVWGTSGRDACVVSQGGSTAYLFTQESLWPDWDTPANWKRNFPYEPNGHFIRAETRDNQICFPLEELTDDHTYILIEFPHRPTPPSLYLSLVCRNGQPAGVDYWAYDGGAGYDTLTLRTSPQRTFYLAPLTQPGTAYYGTIWQVPPVGATAVITLTNQAGLSAVRTLHNPGPAYCAINPPDPGNDHPDDNYSAADAPIPPGQFLAAPAGARMPPPRVAILNRGAAHGLWWLLMQGGNPKPQCPNPNVLASITIVTLHADGVPVCSFVIGHWSLVICHWSLLPTCPVYVTA